MRNIKDNELVLYVCTIICVSFLSITYFTLSDADYKKGFQAGVEHAVQSIVADKSLICKGSR